MRRIVEPPMEPLLADGSCVGGWWHHATDGRTVCDLCPRECHLKPGDRGFCFVRENRDDQIVLSTYGRSTGFCIDPIEKKPLNHFYPGTSVLSFGTAGCNLGCQFCQNWDISKSREVRKLSEHASPDAIARAAVDFDCRSVAFTYNDPIIWAEYAIDTAIECHRLGVRTVAVTAGYMSPAARPAFFEHIDAANIDLKSFSEEFYEKITYSHLEPVLDTIRWLSEETDVWFELTNLIIPDANDSADELRRMCDWIVDSIGPAVPMHFTAFHPDFRMKDRQATPVETLLEARAIARESGIQYAYVGNVDDARHQSTYCPNCEARLIERNWYSLGEYSLDGAQCRQCGYRVAGHFDDRPGDWGRRRQPVQINTYQSDKPQLKRPNPAQDLAEDSSGNPQPDTSCSTESNSSEDAPLEAQDALTVSRESQEALLLAACRFMADEIGIPAESDLVHELDRFAGTIVMGVFVTAKIDGQLRGCCGRLGVPMPISEALPEAARRTAAHDPRFPPIRTDELSQLQIDVTLLHSFKTLPADEGLRLSSVEIGRHGLRIHRSPYSGLLLPAVATEHRLDAVGFLEATSRKAGLPVDAWRDPDAELQTFEGFAFGGPFDASVFHRRPRIRFSSDQLQGLARACAENITLLEDGATPSVYFADLPDTDVSGVVLTIRNGRSERHLQRIELTHDVPLQSSLFQLCQQASSTVPENRHGASVVDITILTDRQDHGSLAHARQLPDTQLQPAILVMNNRESAWAFDGTRDGAELLEDRARALEADGSQPTRVFSFHAASTRPRILVSLRDGANAPVAPIDLRAPAVAGLFYTDDKEVLSRQLDELLAGSRETEPITASAIMAPHAGLRFSGKVAANTFSHVKIPNRVIILGPKHTADGKNWAVAPYDLWSTPLGRLRGDHQFALKLARSVAGLEVDSEAHQREHSIEMMLPFLQKLAPRCTVTGIALGRAELDECLQFARQLAAVLQEDDTPFLLVISSDMNHFADEKTNRRLDEMALQAMESLDPEQLFKTVRENQISMCGCIPAVIALAALRELNCVGRMHRTGYATSADAGGDPSRVVGYAGAVLERS